MSGVDGKRFSLQANLGSSPLGSLVKMNKILPPLLVATAVLGASYFAIKYLRGE
jgi:hypothetical protein